MILLRFSSRVRIELGHRGPSCVTVVVGLVYGNNPLLWQSSGSQGTGRTPESRCLGDGDRLAVQDGHIRELDAFRPISAQYGVLWRCQDQADVAKHQAMC